MNDLNHTSKKCFRAAAGFLCAAALLSFGFPHSEVFGAATVKTTDYLNLRQGAGTNTGVISVLGKNVTLTMLDSSDPQWAKVQTSSGKVGYCSKQYLSQGTSLSSGSTSSGTAVTTANLNLRSGASLTSGILTLLPKGTSVSVVDNSNSQWAQVKTGSGTLGWCSKSFLNISGGTSSGNTSSGTGGATATTTDYLNLRQGAGTGYSVILTLAKGAALTVLDNSNSQWVKVRSQSGKEGWCSRQYLNVSGAQNTDSSQPPASSSSSVPSSSTSSIGTGTSSGGVTGSDSNPAVSATVTADVLRLRESASTGAKILANLTRGTGLTVLDASNSDWVQVRTSDGKTGYVSAQYVSLTYADGTTSGSTGSGDASSLSLSTSSQSIPKGKSLYIKASTNASSVGWSSSNANVAKVVNGYVTAVSGGSAVITAKAGSYQASCNVTVTDAEPVRTAFAAPNVVAPGDTVTLTAVTDTAKDGVKFVVTLPGGGTTTVTASGCQQETTNGVTTKKWTGTASFSTAGTYSVLALSSTGGAYSTTGFTTSAFVNSQSDYTATTADQRRASDKMVQLIATWEGYRASVYADTLTTGSVPTIGYGCTLSANTQFYDNLSQTEAWSKMVNTLNSSSYTTELNKMIQNNHFKMSQNQADCLISFAYNVGAGYFNSSNEMDFVKIMKNAVVPPSFGSGSTYGGTMTADTVVRSDSGILSSQVATVTAGTAVTVTGGDFADTRDGWYQIQISGGASGWVNSAYVKLNNSDSLVHDLNYTNAYAFGTELILWNQAGGKFYTGLFYRRLGEANVYNYNDYSAARYNKYDYGYPSTASSLS